MSRLCSAVLFAVLALLLGAHSAHAQLDESIGLTSSSLPASVQPRYYQSQDSNAISVPTGAVNFNPSPTIELFPLQNTTTATPEDIENLQGCGGVGQSDYTSALYNMPEVFQKFQRDVDTDLARQILTYNYSLPQTAALFDTLNSYGNSRYAQFQQACKLDSLKQDAKNQYMAACVKERLPERLTLVEQAMQNFQPSQQTGSGLKAPNPVEDKEDLIKSQAYAQAWELCALQYSNDSKAIAGRRTSNEAFIKAMREVENVNKAIRPLLCQEAVEPKADENGQQSQTPPATTDTCWATLLLPQVRLCNGADLSTGCTPGTEYGVREAPLGITAFFDLLRFTMESGVVPKLAESLHNSIIRENLSLATQANAASSAVYALSTNGFNTTTPSEPGILAFQRGYLNCKSSDINYLLNRYRLALNGKNPAAAQQSGPTSSAATGIPENITFNSSEYKGIVNNKIQLPTGTEADKAALALLTEVVLGCTVNQVVPIFDPYITANLNPCSDTDRNAFYTMASYDVALSATRDVYRYLNLRLKQVYSRLLYETGAGLSSTTPPPAQGGQATPQAPFDSPELRTRLANAIKEIMIPAVESQIERINELDKSRGQFGQRVQKIYSDKRGCVSDIRL